MKPDKQALAQLASMAASRRTSQVSKDSAFGDSGEIVSADEGANPLSNSAVEGANVQGKGESAELASSRKVELEAANASSKASESSGPRNTIEEKGITSADRSSGNSQATPVGPDMASIAAAAAAAAKR